jgi:glycosyltransferase involved in cell wall biosynthesis
VPRLGLVALETGDRWLGGRYYLHHVARAVDSVSSEHAWRLVPVWWRKAETPDPFAEVAGILDPPAVVGFPATVLGRVARKVRRTTGRFEGAGDLFDRAGIDALFPVPPCADPGRPLVAWIPDLQYRHLPHLFSPELLEEQERHVRRQVREAAMVVSSNDEARRELVELFPEIAPIVRTVPFTVVPTDEERASDPRAVAAKHGLEGPYLVVCNQFSLHKNHRVLFEAMRRLAAAASDAILVCTGSPWSWRGGTYGAELVEFVRAHGLESRIRMPGVVPREEQVALIRGSAALLQPSRFEGWNTSIEEALALGRPVVASRIAVHEEQLREGGGRTVDVDDADAWAAAMAEAATAPEARADPERERAALERARERRRSYGRRFVEVLDAALSSTSRRP